MFRTLVFVGAVEAWGPKGKRVSGANRSVGVLSCPVRSAPPPCRALSRFWIRHVWKIKWTMDRCYHGGLTCWCPIRSQTALPGHATLLRDAPIRPSHGMAGFCIRPAKKMSLMYCREHEHWKFHLNLMHFFAVSLHAGINVIEPKNRLYRRHGKAGRHTAGRHTAGLQGGDGRKRKGNRRVGSPEKQLSLLPSRESEETVLDVYSAVQTNELLWKPDWQITVTGWGPAHNRDARAIRSWVVTGALTLLLCFSKPLASKAHPRKNVANQGLCLDCQFVLSNTEKVHRVICKTTHA